MRPPPRPALAALAGLFAGLLAAGCAARHPARPHLAPPARAVPPAAPAAVPPPAWQPPAQAVEVASAYVRAALSYSWTQPPGAWVAQVRSWCTPQWAAALDADADGGTGGWAAIVADRDTATAAVLAVYPMAGPGPAQPVEVTATVTVSGVHPAVRPAALAVDLLRGPDGVWKVGWAG